MKSRTKNTLYFLLGLGLLAAVFHQVDAEKMRAVAERVHPAWFVAMVALGVFQFYLASIVWLQLLRRRSKSASLLRLFRIYLVSNFVATVLPTKYSGDLVRIVGSTREAGSPSEAAAAVLIERSIGILALLAMGLVASFAGRDVFRDTRITMFLGAVFGLLVIGLWLSYSGKTGRAVDRLLARFGWEGIRRKVLAFNTALHGHTADPAFLVLILIESIVFKTVAFVCIDWAARALGFTIPVVTLMLIMPMIYVLEALPISVNGFGIREGAFLWFFSQAGWSKEEAFALSLVVFAGRLLIAGIGGLNFLAERAWSFRRSGVRAAGAPVAAVVDVDVPFEGAPLAGASFEDADQVARLEQEALKGRSLEEAGVDGGSR